MHVQLLPLSKTPFTPPAQSTYVNVKRFSTQGQYIEESVCSRNITTMSMVFCAYCQNNIYNVVMLVDLVTPIIILCLDLGVIDPLGDVNRRLPS